MMILSSKRTFGAAAALFGLSVAVVPWLGAQTGTVTPSSGVVRLRVVNPNQAQLDTLHALMRELEQLTPGSPAHEILMRQIDGLLPAVAGNSLMLRPGGAAGPAVGMMSRIPLPAGWIGINVQGLSAQMVENNRFIVAYFDHPSITSVDPDSPAQHAGIAPGDVLLAYNGSDVVGHQFDLTDLLVPDKKLAITVERGGDTKVFDVTVAKAPRRIDIRRQDLGSAPQRDVYFERIISGEDDVPRGAVTVIPRGAVVQRVAGSLVTPNSALGAVMSTVSPELAKTLKLETGVLVNDVSDGSPAERAGLKPGDVIVEVEGQAVESLRALQEQILRRPERSAALTVVRERKTRKLTVSW